MKIFSKKILFYTGYHQNPWSPQSFEKKGLGGSETALLNVAVQLKKLGYIIYITGSVINGKWKGIEFMDHVTMHEQLKEKHFHAIVATNYIHFLKEFESFDFDHSIFWIHNTDFFPWWRGKELPNGGRDLLVSNRLSAIVYLTNWHQERLLRDFPEMHQKKMVKIPNGINTTIFPQRIQKVSGRFIYSSAAERGLEQLLNYWPTIVEHIPHASLHVCSPVYALNDLHNFKEIFDQYSNIKLLGALPQHQLYEEICAATYWIHPTQYEETYCITALEMQYGKAAIITTKLAALEETVNDRGILLTKEDMNNSPNTMLEKLLLLEKHPEIRTSISNYAHQWAKEQTWEKRALDWVELIEQL